MSETLQNLLAYYLWTVSPLATTQSTPMILLRGNASSFLETLNTWMSESLLLEFLAVARTNCTQERSIQFFFAHHLFQNMLVPSSLSLLKSCAASQTADTEPKNMVKAAKAPCFQISFCDFSYCADSIRQTNCLFVQDAVSKVLFQNLKPMSQVR